LNNLAYYIEALMMLKTLTPGFSVEASCCGWSEHRNGGKHGSSGANHYKIFFSSLLKEE